MKLRHQTRLVVLLLVAIAAIGLATYRTGMTQMGGMDEGVLVNAAWEQHIGYHPYSQFPSGFPPLFFMGARLAFAVFGVQWSSLIFINVLFSSLVAIAIYVCLVKMHMSPLMALLLPITSLCMTVMPSGFWWYNQTTALSACLAACASGAFVVQPDSKTIKAMLALGMTLLLMAKPNVTGVMIVALIAMFVTSRSLRKPWLQIVVLALVASLGLEIAFGMNPLLMIASYWRFMIRMHNRGGASLFLPKGSREAIPSYLFIVPALLLVSVLLVKWKKLNSTLTPQARMLCALGLAVFATGCIAIVTNNDVRTDELSYILFAPVFLYTALFHQLSAQFQKVAAGILAVTCLLFCAWDANVASQHLRAIGSCCFYEETGGLKQVKDPHSFFANFAAGARFQNSLDAVGYALQNIGVDPSTHVYFGPRMDYSYAVYGLKPVAGLPLCWDGYNDLPDPLTASLIERFQQANFRAIFFWHGDAPFMPIALEQYLIANYDAYNFYDAKKGGEVLILTQKAAHP